MEARLTTALPPASFSSPIGSGAPVGHYPRLAETDAPGPASVADVEALLTEWFGAPVLLLASGRTALHLYLQAKGFHRYRQNLQVSPYLAVDVLAAITPSAFPVHLPAEGDGILFYHQYGFPQRRRPTNSVVIEDVAHTFFASPSTGARDWAGEAAIFSLPKFFAMGGSAGGLIVHDEALADRIRETVRNTPAAPPGVKDWMRRVSASPYRGDLAAPEVPFVGSAYELLLHFVSPEPEDLAGFPASIADIRQIGEARLERVRFFCSFFDVHGRSPGLWSDEEELLPFALPYFGSGKVQALERASVALEEQGVRAGTYHLDVNRNMYETDYQKCLLLPCHQNVSMETFEAICRTVQQHDRG